MSKKINDGGPAFPVPLELNANDETIQPESSGMTLRDWFAGQAMNGWVSCSETAGEKKDAAGFAYKMADAMIEARKPRTS